MRKRKNWNTKETKNEEKLVDYLVPLPLVHATSLELLYSTSEAGNSPQLVLE